MGHNAAVYVALWGVPKGCISTSSSVLIACSPDAHIWSASFCGCCPPGADNYNTCIWYQMDLASVWRWCCFAGNSALLPGLLRVASVGPLPGHCFCLCVLPLAALLLWEKQVRGCCCALCCNCWSPHSWLLQSDAAPGCGNICNCLGQCYWAGAQDGNLPLLMPVGTSGYPPFHWWGGVPGESALSLSDRWCGVALPAECSSRSPVASNQLLYLTSLCCTHLLLNMSLPKKKIPEKVSIPTRCWPTVPTRL